MAQNPSQDQNTSETTGTRNTPRQIEIPVTRYQRGRSLILYILFFAAIAAAFVTLFARFTGSVPVAIWVVVPMVGFMLWQGWLAGRNMDDRER